MTDEKLKKYKRELDRVANRDSVDQFFNVFPTEREQYFLGRNEVSNQDFLGIIDDYDGEYVTVISKNYFKSGDKVEIVSPSRDTTKFTMPSLYDSDNNILDASRHPEKIVKFKLDKKVEKYDMLRFSNL
jgi:putative protease